MRCEKAGRDHNEDDCCLIVNLADGQPGFKPDREFLLDKKGAMLVVCDGMGGMNAGEAASKRAVETIREWFMPDNLTGETTTAPEAVRKYIAKAIVDADGRIKNESKSDKAKEGMGSTVVMAWIIGERVYVGWCGDSRAYRFNPVDGLVRLSHDHSYVQELADSGTLSEELAFDHPHGNIITRSLGDPKGTARPDVKDYDLRNGDVIMLCSDGLCGVLRDDEIEKIIRNHTKSMRACRDALWEAACNAGWHDNVTVELCQILSGCSQNAEPTDNKESNTGKQINKQMWMVTLIVTLLLGLLGGYFFSRNGSGLWKTFMEIFSSDKTTAANQREYSGITRDGDSLFISVSVLQTDSTLQQILDDIAKDPFLRGKIGDSDSLECDVQKIAECNPEIINSKVL
jgi:serine/threonine protein phosphatase PrpC